MANEHSCSVAIGIDCSIWGACCLHLSSRRLRHWESNHGLTFRSLIHTRAKALEMLYGLLSLSQKINRAFGK
jgi:hypothetical protein